MKININQKEEIYRQQIQMSWQFYLNLMSSSHPSPLLLSNNKKFRFISAISLSSSTLRNLLEWKFVYTLNVSSSTFYSLLPIYHHQHHPIVTRIFST